MLRASLGQCFRWQNDGTCPRSCDEFASCQTCLARPECGWCQSGPNGSGNGTCVRGDSVGPFDPTDSTCSRENGTLSLSNEVLDSNWSFFMCPNINDCAYSDNGTALLASPCSTAATCQDLDTTSRLGSDYVPSYSCACLPGYSGNGRICTPQCTQFGCSREHGNCTSPDVCSCAAGWTTANCSQPCGCNFHCDCHAGGPNNFVCLDNTTGPFCELCDTGFYGNASNGGTCSSCSPVCNGMSDTCELRRDNLDANSSSVWCLACSGHTTGRLCELCEAGYLQSPSGGCFEVVQPSPFPASSSSVTDPVADIDVDPSRWALARATAVPAQLDASSNFRYGIALEPSNSSTGRNVLVAIFTSGNLNAINVNVMSREENDTRVFQPQLALARNYDMLQIVISCTAADFYEGTLFIEFRSSDVAIDLDYALLWGARRNVQCAVCTDCRAPCVTGLYQQPDRRNQCVECECLGHGDVCDVRTGGYCGVRAAGCTGLSPTNCQCAHGTVSSDAAIASQQCDRCAPTLLAHIADNDDRGRAEHPRMPCYSHISMS